MPESTEYVQVLDGPKARWTAEGMKVTLSDGVTTFYIPALEVLTVRNFCNSFMKYHGARDARGREVIDPESGNP